MPQSVKGRRDEPFRRSRSHPCPDASADSGSLPRALAVIRQNASGCVAEAHGTDDRRADGGNEGESMNTWRCPYCDRQLPDERAVCCHEAGHAVPASLCEDCPPSGYPTDATRCTPCPRREPLNSEASEDDVDHSVCQHGVGFDEDCDLCDEFENIGRVALLHERCNNFPCCLLRGHEGPCRSAP